MYHISKSDKIVTCSAHKIDCPREHFETEADANKFLASAYSKEYGELPVASSANKTETVSKTKLRVTAKTGRAIRRMREQGMAVRASNSIETVQTRRGAYKFDTSEVDLISESAGSTKVEHLIASHGRPFARS